MSPEEQSLYRQRSGMPLALISKQELGTSPLSQLAIRPGVQLLQTSSQRTHRAPLIHTNHTISHDVFPQKRESATVLTEKRRKLGKPIWGYRRRIWSKTNKTLKRFKRTMSRDYRFHSSLVTQYCDSEQAMLLLRAPTFSFKCFFRNRTHESGKIKTELNTNHLRMLLVILLAIKIMIFIFKAIWEWYTLIYFISEVT